MADIAQLLPFHVLVDDRDIIRSVGPSLRKVANAAQIEGCALFDVVHFLKPKSLTAQSGLRAHLGRRLTVSFPSIGASGPTTTFGMGFAVDFDGAPHVMLALTPGANARAYVKDHGLTIADFGPSDGSAELLPLLAMQADMLEDSKRQYDRLIAARNAAERIANLDALTDLPNRRALMAGLEKALLRGAVCVLHLDLDKFKDINDTFGHAAGDEALKHAARAMREVLGAETLCARLGGDEFVAVLDGAHSDKDLKTIAKRLNTQISRPFSFEGERLTVGVSIGLTQSRPETPITPDEILHEADLALYEVKRAGRGSAMICTPELLQAQNAFQDLSADIRRGLGASEFLAFLQPQVDTQSNTVCGVEALARWMHPTHGLLEPASFLETADRAGLLQDIDTQVRASALDTLREGDEQEIFVPKISLNVTTGDLVDPHFRHTLMWDLDRQGLDPSRVNVEIVESVFFDENATQITQACESLVADGFLLCLDDFGTGHASALSLVNLPLRIVKIDRAFTTGLEHDPRRQAMARSLVGMATTLDLDVVAEGVGDRADVALLEEMGCSRFQSFFFARPMPRTALFAWLDDREAKAQAIDRA